MTALRDLAVLVDDGERSRVRARLALNVAARHGARLTGIYMILEPGFPTNADDEMPNELIDFIAAQCDRAINKAAAAFREDAARAGVSADWAVVAGDWRAVTRAVIERTRAADLIFAGQTMQALPDLPDQLVLDAGRPVIYVPDRGAFEDIGSRVMIAWNSSREATRALNDAMPIIEQADDVTVITIEDDELSATPQPEMRIAAHLSRHGVTARLRQSYVRTHDIGEVILSRAADAGADLLIMGAYGHSRLRECVLGGATRHLLGHMTVPVLMSH